MKGCLSGCLSSVTDIVIAFVGLLIIIGVISSITDNSDNSDNVKKVKPSTIQHNVIKNKPRQSITRSKKNTIPKYERVADNSNDHSIFIVTQATKKSELKAIVADYKMKWEVPSYWMIHFFSNKQKAIRVQDEWSWSIESDPNYDQWWVYDENVDHSGIAQWTSWDGLTMNKW